MKGKKAKAVEIDFNPEFQHALTLMEDTARNIFITGRAGTGKSTLLNYFRDNTSKKVVILAPTGVAAVNVTPDVNSGHETLSQAATCLA